MVHVPRTLSVGFTAASLIVSTIGLAATASAAPNHPNEPRTIGTSPLVTTSYVVTFAEDSRASDVVADAETAEDITEALPEAATDVLDGAAKEWDASVESVTAHSGNVASVELSEGLNAKDAAEFIEDLESSREVEKVEPNIPMLPAALPNDADFNRQWSLLEAEHGINARGAWEKANGRDVTVAVIDSGIVSHPDLDDNVISGYDFISQPGRARDFNGRDDDPTDEGDWNYAGQCGFWSRASTSSFHGTHVAGIIGASANNREGIAGVAYGSKILPVRALGLCGGLSTDIADGIRWAAGEDLPGIRHNDHPAKVINMSLGGRGQCPSYYQDAINEATNRGAIVVVAAGNEDRNVADVVPANCDNVITVGATGGTGNRSFYSNYGDGVAISAPGGDEYVDSLIYSTVDTGTTDREGPGYEPMQGTSQATPHVSGIVAMLAQHKPGITVDEAKRILRETANPIQRCGRSYCGAGIADAKKAVDRLIAEEGLNVPAVEPFAASARDAAGAEDSEGSVDADAAEGAQPVESDGIRDHLGGWFNWRMLDGEEGIGGEGTLPGLEGERSDSDAPEGSYGPARPGETGELEQPAQPSEPSEPSKPDDDFWTKPMPRYELRVSPFPELEELLKLIGVLG